MSAAQNVTNRVLMKECSPGDLMRVVILHKTLNHGAVVSLNAVKRVKADVIMQKFKNVIE